MGDNWTGLGAIGSRVTCGYLAGLLEEQAQRSWQEGDRALAASLFAASAAYRSADFLGGIRSLQEERVERQAADEAAARSAAAQHTRVTHGPWR